MFRQKRRHGKCQLLFNKDIEKGVVNSLKISQKCQHQKCAHTLTLSVFSARSISRSLRGETRIEHVSETNVQLKILLYTLCSINKLTASES